MLHHAVIPKQYEAYMKNWLADMYVNSLALYKVLRIYQIAFYLTIFQSSWNIDIFWHKNIYMVSQLINEENFIHFVWWKCFKVCSDTDRLNKI